MEKELFKKRDQEMAFSDQEKLIDNKKENEIIFTPEQLSEIENKRQILSSIAYFIGKDFEIPVELNNPGGGWHWDFENNIIKIDPKDLIEKSMDYLRFVISHEAGHRRISRTDFIPLEEWIQPGFSFMMNAIEDPRDNNFVAENYPKFREQMSLAYVEDLDFEKKAKEQAAQKLGYQPRFMQAGFEYIKQWFKEIQGQEIDISTDLPNEVKNVVQATIKQAQDSWWRYPSREEADKSEDLIKKYAQVSYEINRDEIWPEFKKLVEADIEDQKIQEFLKDMQEGKKNDGNNQSLPQELKDKLTPEEQKNLEEVIEEAIKDSKKDQKKGKQEEVDGKDVDGKDEDNGKKDEKDSSSDKKNKSESVSTEASQSKAVDLDSLSDELKQKIKEYIDSLPEKEKKDLEKKAETILKEFERSVNEDLQGKLSQNPEEISESKKLSEPTTEDLKDDSWTKSEQVYEKEKEILRKKIESLFEKKEKSPYQDALIETSELIDSLTANLRDIFTKRKIEKYETGYRSGRRWNIRQRIREKVSGIPLFKTEAREQRTSESEEMDYAVTLLIDLSGSMARNNKIEETFKSTVVLAETLNNLGINFEVVGFQDILLEFKSFQDRLNELMKEKLNGMILEVYDSNPGGHNNARDNDDAVALLEASKHLANQTAKNKFLIVLSDGLPETSYKNSSQLSRELKEAVAEVTTNTNQKIIGIGLMSDAVKKYYENHIAEVSTEEMVEILSELLREIIEKY